MQSYGPKIVEKYVNSGALIKFIDDCTKYIEKLPDFNRYCIWRYTIGSASINSYLILGKLSDNSTQWIYLFFKYYKNTFGKAKVLPKGWNKWFKYFDNPQASKNLSDSDKRDIIIQYIFTLQNIIKNGPKPTGTFHVFKVASPYPQLPKPEDKLPVEVLQLPFNSTTINPYFNFAPFINPANTCCFFDIEVPKGANCLYIPQELHAYPFEREIILPTNCIFRIENIRTGILDYVDSTSVNPVMVQPKDNIKMGNVYELNEYYPCTSGKCDIQSKLFTVYDTVLN